MELLLAIIWFILYLRANKRFNSNAPVEVTEYHETTDAEIEALRALLPPYTPQIKVMEIAANNLVEVLEAQEQETSKTSYTIRELKKLASAAKIKNYGDMKKAELVTALAL